MVENKILDLEIRRKIYSYILKSPGLYERELSRELNIPLSTLDYHLRHLKRRNLITITTDGRYARHYAAGKIGLKDKHVIAMLRQSTTRSIILFLLLNPHSSHKGICNHLGLAPSTTSFHLRKLVDLKITDSSQVGKETIYFVKERNYVSNLLITYKKSFLDKAVDQFIKTWLEVHPRYLRKSKKKRQRKKE